MRPVDANGWYVGRVGECEGRVGEVDGWMSERKSDCMCKTKKH